MWFQTVSALFKSNNPGDEKEAWSDDNDSATELEKVGEKSDSTQDGRSHPELTSEPTKDGYSSGDMGDVSQFYATEVGIMNAVLF